ncbi:uncharacterized protein FOMMEDRAFT_158529 [Fomitiporia mediterranea MF3/22]|uniref:uncharacterized protein n=1 Tax=Fomitiporia mediterranea (strain MF3/22) TaxID=694068 RepID=UPI0004408DAF|nr:uncharacterized protein FOMMEDRAFT_158529 [Fomitiporia mediterranea MF3/22]EJD01388.1 hypothetical protein FOMMEDRAFT_158529 [Fomitiporia mediterranea MF3/22]
MEDQLTALVLVFAVIRSSTARKCVKVGKSPQSKASTRLASARERFAQGLVITDYSVTKLLSAQYQPEGVMESSRIIAGFDVLPSQAGRQILQRSARDRTIRTAPLMKPSSLMRPSSRTTARVIEHHTCKQYLISSEWLLYHPWSAREQSPRNFDVLSHSTEEEFDEHLL